jgi:hypothetical protein
MPASEATFDPTLFLSFARAQMTDLADAFGAATQQPLTFPWSPVYPNFWQVGCVFDTILDYFVAMREAGALQPGDQKLMETLLPQAVTGYQLGIVGLSAGWYDDWAWWGIAASKAFDADYEEIFGAQLGFFQSAAMDLWGVVDSGDFATIANSLGEAWNNAPTFYGNLPFSAEILSARSNIHMGTRNAWALIERGENGQGTRRQNVDYARFTGTAGWAVPRFQGGCWQYDFSSWAFDCNDGPCWAAPDPQSQTLGVFQVTLMSGLYLSFCCSLIAAAERKAAEGKSGAGWDRLEPAATYRQCADEVVAFLNNWINLAGTESLVASFPAGKLIHERTPTYAALEDGSCPAVRGYVAGAYWAGDQGLIMGALKQYAALTPGASAGLADSLLTGVFYNMTTKAPESPVNAVGPWLELSGPSPISGDPDDYGSGSGIFWRYVMRCCRLDPAFASSARNDPSIRAVAENSGTNACNWASNNPLFTPFDGVAAGIGAWYLLAGPSAGAAPGADPS